jgi:hypothetical protein
VRQAFEEVFEAELTVSPTDTAAAAGGTAGQGRDGADDVEGLLAEIRRAEQEEAVLGAPA